MMGRSTRTHKKDQDARFNAQPIWTGDPPIDAVIARFFEMTDAELHARSVHRIAEHWRDHGTEGVRPVPQRSDKPWAVPKQRRANEHTWTRKEVMEARG